MGPGQGPLTEASTEPGPSTGPSPSDDPCALAPVGASPEPQASPIEASPEPTSAAPEVDPCAPEPTPGNVTLFGVGSSIAGFVWSDVNANGIY